jgi:hypothetical protein
MGVGGIVGPSDSITSLDNRLKSEQFSEVFRGAPKKFRQPSGAPLA